MYPWQLLHRLGLNFMCTKDLFLYHFSGLWRFRWMTEGSHTIAEVGGLCQSPGDSGPKRPPHLPTADFSRFSAAWPSYNEKGPWHIISIAIISVPDESSLCGVGNGLCYSGTAMTPMVHSSFAASIYLDLPSLRLSGSWTYLEWNIHGFSRGSDVLINGLQPGTFPVYP